MVIRGKTHPRPNKYKAINMQKNFTEKLKTTVAKCKFGDFLRNLIAVVLGIIVTFVGNDIITERNEQSDVKKALQLVKNELISNREHVQSAQDRIKLENRAAIFLLKNRHNIDAVSNDSLNLYSGVPLQLAREYYTNDAMEMLKSSAIFQKIKNENLALQIITAYSEIKSTDESYKTFYAIKKQFQEAIIATSELHAANTMADTWKYLFSTPQGVALVKQILEIMDTDNLFEHTINSIDRTIAMINIEL